MKIKTLRHVIGPNDQPQKPGVNSGAPVPVSVVSPLISPFRSNVYLRDSIYSK